MGCAKRPQKIGCVTTQTSSFPPPVPGFNQAFNCLSDLALCSFANRATPRFRNAAPVLVFPILVACRRDACSLRRYSVNGSERSVPTKATPENEELFRCNALNSLFQEHGLSQFGPRLGAQHFVVPRGPCNSQKMVIRSFNSTFIRKHLSLYNPAIRLWRDDKVVYLARVTVLNSIAPQGRS